MDEAGDRSHDLRSTVTALRLLVDGWRDGLVDARPGTADGERLLLHVRALGALVEAIPPAAPTARRPEG